MNRYYLVYEALADDPQSTSTLQAVFTREGDAAEYEQQKQERARHGWTYYTRVRGWRGQQKSEHVFFLLLFPGQFYLPPQI